MYSWYKFVFHTFAVLIVVHALNEKTGRKQDKKKGAKQRKEIKSLLSSPTHLAHHCSTVEPLSLRYRSAIALLSPQYRYALTLLSLRCHNAITPLLFRCRYAAVDPLSRSCHTAITPVSLHCCSAAVAPAVATQLHRYRTAIAPLSLCCCRS